MTRETNDVCVIVLASKLRKLEQGLNKCAIPGTLSAVMAMPIPIYKSERHGLRLPAATARATLLYKNKVIFTVILLDPKSDLVTKR